MRYFEDCTVGSTGTFGEKYELTEAEIIEMGERWDPQPFHIDPEAARTSVFGGLVASSVHLFAICIHLGVKGDPTAAVSSLGFRSVQNRSPARPGDRLSLMSKVLEARRSKSRPECGIVTTQTELANQTGEVVFYFENAAMVRCRDGSNSPVPDSFF